LSQPTKVRGKKAPRALAAGGTEMPFPAAETPGAPAAQLAGVSISPRFRRPTRSAALQPVRKASEVADATEGGAVAEATERDSPPCS